MGIDVIYTNGVIAAREKYLLKDRIFKLCEGSAQEAFRVLSESGFGSGAAAESAYDFETLVTAEERALDDFIREYAPSRAEAVYLLSPRDFHNAKALLKAKYLETDAEKLLAPEGLISVAELVKCLENRDFSRLGKKLDEALTKAEELLSAEDVSGAAVGVLFEKALFAHLQENCGKNKVLKKLLTVKADMSNILTVFRSSDKETAVKAFVSGGKLNDEQLKKLFDGERAVLEKTPYTEFGRACFEAKEAGQAFTAAEKMRDSREAEFFFEKRFELEKSQPFLFYVFRRRMEIENVRIIFVCLLAGMKEQEIKRRLRLL